MKSKYEGCSAVRIELRVSFTQTNHVFSAIANGFGCATEKEVAKTGYSTGRKMLREARRRWPCARISTAYTPLREPAFMEPRVVEFSNTPLTQESLPRVDGYSVSGEQSP
jgi:hypothetical protein